MLEYVVGFLHSEDKSLVVLIKKQRPKWQKGRLNGVGGHIEPGETPLAAMRREFKEEAGLTIADWKLAVEITAAAWRVHFFTCRGPVRDAQTQTDEALRLVSLNSEWPLSILPNLRWLIPLCLDSDIAKPVIVHDVTAQPVEKPAEAAGGD